MASAGGGKVAAQRGGLVLVACDNSQSALKCLQYALQAYQGYEFQLLHVMHRQHMELAGYPDLPSNGKQLEIEDSSNFISRKLLPICDSSGVPKEKVAAFLIGADSSGSSGIGKAICQRAEDVNADVVVASRHSKEGATSAVVTDVAIPEGHKGLHQALYGEGSEEAHSAAQYALRQGEDEGRSLVQVTEYILSRDGAKPVGVYALYDSQQQLQYIGLARNMVLAIKGHLTRVGPEHCAYVRAKVFTDKALTSRANLDAQRQAWIKEAGFTPAGNAEDQAFWEVSGSKIMSQAEREEYEDKRLKMRKAMGDKLHDEAAAAEVSGDQRRQNMIDALSKDDWSAVIEQQTEQTLGSGAAAANAAPQVPADSATTSGQGSAVQPQPAITSPFASSGAQDAAGAPASLGGAPEMTVESVDAALEKVRPYLIADGGNVRVVDVSNGIVELQLQGACGTCAASSATMKDGIERCLEGVFRGSLKGVVQSGGGQDNSASKGRVNTHLDMLRPAIQSYGGKVDVLSVEAGKCIVHFEGPPPIGEGIKAAIKDKFPDLQAVELV